MSMIESLDNYEVVRQDFYVTYDEPQLTFNQGRMYVNSYCVKSFTEENYIQVLVDRMGKAMVIKPIKDKVKDSFRWCGMNEKRKARHMRCVPLFYLTYRMMKWDVNNRYCITGHIEEANGEKAIYFQLKDARCFVPVRKDEKTRRPIYKQYMPEEWNMSFGISLKEYGNGECIMRYEEDGVFEIELPFEKERVQRLKETKSMEGEESNGRTIKQA